MDDTQPTLAPTAPNEMPGKSVGQPLSRVDGRLKVTGGAKLLRRYAGRGRRLRRDGNEQRHSRQNHRH